MGHPLALNSFRYWLRLLRSGGGVDSRYRLRMATVTLASPLTSPLRLWERLRYEKRVEATEITHPPIFVVGHWRTGTTHLHNLLCQDPNLAYVTLFHTLAPGSLLAGRHVLRPLLALLTPEKRPMDNMALALGQPQEEEFALCHQCPHSFYLGWYFPRRMKELFRKYALLEGISEEALRQWRKAYLTVFKKATFVAGGRRLVSKNPVNTGRLGAILDLFPEAKFIHIHRNPYVVYKSTKHLHRKVLDLVTLQEISDGEIEENVLLFFREMMQGFLREKALIPPGHLAEVRFEDLEARPVEEMARLYDSLGIPGWTQAEPRIDAYLAGQKTYEKNQFSFSEEDMEKVEAHWRFALDEWGYERPAANGSTLPRHHAMRTAP